LMPRILRSDTLSNRLFVPGAHVGRKDHP